MYVMIERDERWPKDVPIPFKDTDVRRRTNGSGGEKTQAKQWRGTARF